MEFTERDSVSDFVRAPVTNRLDVCCFYFWSPVWSPSPRTANCTRLVVDLFHSLFELLIALFPADFCVFSFNGFCNLFFITFFVRDWYVALFRVCSSAFLFEVFLSFSHIIQWRVPVDVDRCALLNPQKATG
jgi:hypothetical protein